MAWCSVRAPVDVNGLIATTSNLSRQSTPHKLVLGKPGNPNASVVNNGTITAKLGKVQLASGDTATVDLYGDKLMEVAVSDKVCQ